MPVRTRWTRYLCAAAALLAGCGSESTPLPPTSPPQAQRYTVTSVIDGDTLRFNPPLLTSTSLRLLNIDAPEGGGETQEPWAAMSRANLQRMLSTATDITIETDRERTDAFSRVLGHATRADGVNVNAEQLRLGHAVLYVIWPNMAHFSDYRRAQIEAQTSGRGIWSSTDPFRELPFEFRLRADRAVPFRPVGDVFTRSYVEAADYRLIHVNNRVFFDSAADATAAGYRLCARDDASVYNAACFSAADRELGGGLRMLFLDSRTHADLAGCAKARYDRRRC